MGIWLIAAVVVVILVVLAKVFDCNYLMSSLIAIVVLIALLLSVNIPGDYYQYQEIEPIKLRNSLKDEDGQSVSRYINGVGRLLIIESDEVTEPTLFIYKSGYKSNFWTFSLIDCTTWDIIVLPKTEETSVYERAY